MTNDSDTAALLAALESLRDDPHSFAPWAVAGIAARAVDTITALRSPAPGAEAMRGALYCTLCGRETPHSPVPDPSPPTFTATALPAPEVPEVFSKWAASFRQTVAIADPEDIWPEEDFSLLEYFEKEYGI